MELRPCVIKYIDLHHTAGHEKNTAQVKQEHLKQGWGDIGYNAVIEMDGTIGMGRDIKYSGAHDPGMSPDGVHTMNQAAYAISHIGTSCRTSWVMLSFGHLSGFAPKSVRSLA